MTPAILRECAVICSRQVMHALSTAEILDFLARRPFSVIHVDALWDGYREPLALKMAALERRFQHVVSFGTIDSDVEVEYVKKLGILNLPATVYYRHGQVFDCVVGLGQDIALTIEHMMQDKS